MKLLAALGGMTLAFPFIAVGPAAADPDTTVIAPKVAATCTAKVSTKYTKSSAVKSAVAATDVVASMEPSVYCTTVNKIVAKGVNAGYEKPYRSNGYKCTPSVSGDTTAFVCKFAGADNPTKAVVTFKVVYR